MLDSIYPYPDGARYEGAAAVRARWAEVFRTSPDLWCETEERFAVADRCIFRWIGHRSGQDGQPEHDRGVDIFAGARRKSRRKTGLFEALTR